MKHLHAFLVLPGTNAHKRYAVAVFRVHIGLYLEHETAEFFFDRFYLTRLGVA